MGELGITIRDLTPCSKCGHSIPLIFENEKTGWYITCAYPVCGHATKTHTELLEAADEWGLK